MQLTRRTFFKGAVLITSTVALAACSPAQPKPRGYDGDPRTLPIPPLIDGTSGGTHRAFELTAQEGVSEMLPGVQTTTWGYNGALLGPTLRMANGDDVTATIINHLGEMTTVHWHGMIIPAKSDGGPHSPIEPGESLTVDWKVNQPAATLWYHPHPHMRTALHAYRGLAGMIIIDDEVSKNLDIPNEYGVDDIPVVITDQKFTDKGQLDETEDDTLGLTGDTPIVNGIANAKFEATTRRVRMRIVNGATMRFYNLAFSDDRPITILATDAGFLSAPLEVDTLLIGPGERLEIVVDLDIDDKVQLVSVPLHSNFGIPSDVENAPDFGFQDKFELLAITGPAEGATPAPLPTVLDPKADEVPDTTNAPERTFDLNTFSINGKMMDMNRIDFEIDHKGPEVWKVTNTNHDWPHNFHIHDSRFKVIGVENTTEKAIFTKGWRDTVAVPPGTTVELAVEFGYYPDPKFPYMYHCHMLFHEDNGMMGQFVIVDPHNPAAKK